MTVQESIAHSFTISVRQPVDPGDGYHVSYAPRSTRPTRGNGDAPRQVPTPFEAVVRVQGEATSVHWVSIPQNPEVTEEEFGQDASSRAAILHGWLERYSSLLSSVETWVKELDWATRRIEIPMEDSKIGKYKVSGLLMQEGKDRILLSDRPLYSWVGGGRRSLPDAGLRRYCRPLFLRRSLEPPLSHAGDRWHFEGRGTGKTALQREPSGSPRRDETECRVVMTFTDGRAGGVSPPCRRPRGANAPRSPGTPRSVPIELAQRMVARAWSWTVFAG